MCKTDIPFPTLACGNCVLQVFIVHICWSMTNSHQTMSQEWECLEKRQNSLRSSLWNVSGYSCLLLEHSWTSIHHTESLISMYQCCALFTQRMKCDIRGTFHPGLFVIFLQKYLNSKVFTIIALQYFSEHSNDNYF